MAERQCIPVLSTRGNTGRQHVDRDRSLLDMRLPLADKHWRLWTQWRGVRLLHIKLQQGPRSAADFAELPDCRARIDVLVQLLTKPATDPMNQFPLDVSASTSMRIGRPPRHLIQQVMQAQMVGLVLGVLAQLALADSYSLAQHIYKLEGLQLLHDIAMGRTQHAHPELQDASEVRKL